MIRVEMSRKGTCYICGTPIRENHVSTLVIPRDAAPRMAHLYCFALMRKRQQQQGGRNGSGVAQPSTEVERAIHDTVGRGDHAAEGGADSRPGSLGRLPAYPISSERRT